MKPNEAALDSRREGAHGRQAHRAAPAYVADASARFEQTQLDRGITAQAGPSGYAASGATAAVGSANAWAGDHNFVAPAV